MGRGLGRRGAWGASQGKPIEARSRPPSTKWVPRGAAAHLAGQSPQTRMGRPVRMQGAIDRYDAGASSLIDGRPISAGTKSQSGGRSEGRGCHCTGEPTKKGLSACWAAWPSKQSMGRTLLGSTAKQSMGRTLLAHIVCTQQHRCSRLQNEKHNHKQKQRNKETNKQRKNQAPKPKPNKTTWGKINSNASRLSVRTRQNWSRPQNPPKRPFTLIVLSTIPFGRLSFARVCGVDSRIEASTRSILGRQAPG